MLVFGKDQGNWLPIVETSPGTLIGGTPGASHPGDPQLPKEGRAGLEARASGHALTQACSGSLASWSLGPA